MKIVLDILMFAGGMWVFLGVIMTVQDFRLRRASLKPLPEEPRPGEEDRWAGRNGFVFLGAYQLLAGVRTTMWVWQGTERHMFFCKYRIETKQGSQITYDLVTEFSGGSALTTCSSRGGQFYPKAPGHYTQSFSGGNLDDFWRRHVEGENYLMDAGGAELVMKELDFAASVTESIQRQSRYMRSLRLWFFRAPIWYFIRQNRWHGVSVADQHRRGWVKMPKEIRQGFMAMR